MLSNSRQVSAAQCNVSECRADLTTVFLNDTGRRCMIRRAAAQLLGRPPKLGASTLGMDNDSASSRRLEPTSAHVDSFRDEEAARLNDVRSRLASRYGVHGEFVGVSTLARVLGVGETTLYDYIRAGRFALPCRMFNRTPKVAVDDLARWMIGGENLVIPGGTSAPRSTVPPSRGGVSPRVQAAVRESLANMGL